uniref:Uncharacterized protein n=1 Tax=Rhizophora mucronata TaxID=61149 RepID=A0A2P2N5P9_RHIMU
MQGEMNLPMVAKLTCDAFCIICKWSKILSQFFEGPSQTPVGASKFESPLG